MQNKTIKHRNLQRICAALWFGAVLWATVPSAGAVEEGKPAPSIEARLLDGKPFSLSAESGHVVIVHFWATWCAPCRLEMPVLEKYYRQHQAEGVRILAISMDDPADDGKVREIMRAFSYSAALQRDVHFKGYGRIWRMPMTFVIDRQGVLRRDGGVGESTIDASTLDAIVTPLLDNTH
ncbi:MAG: TlpA family protein disulfide reductase [Burkholderiaceae bacterium]|nr:MAG: TlpA family protein disulfide reductase [Burkholderiaceae bacterium]